MSRKATFLSIVDSTGETFKVGLHSFYHGATPSISNNILWDALMEALVSIPDKTIDQGLLRRREEARAAMRTRVEWLNKKVEGGK